MDQVKEAFQKVKEDITSLRTEISNLQKELQEIQISILTLIKTQNLQYYHPNQPNFEPIRQTDNPTIRQTDTSTHSSTDNSLNRTLRQINSTDKGVSTHSSTDILPFKALKGQNTQSSIGNRGVSTDRQTIRQTDTSTDFTQEKAHFRDYSTHFSNQPTIANISQNSQKEPLNFPRQTNENPSKIPNPAIVLDQLDAIKKDIRLKIKRLTNQEMLVLSSIYQLEDQGFIVDYPLLSSKLSLSESSIRDYIQRIISKGINLTKEKVNNKKIIVHIPSDFRKLASLDTLIKLREL